MSYGRPGVYINERLLPAPIASTGTANAAGAVVGAFAQGPETLTLVTSWYDFVKKFGGYNAAFPATFGVGQFFLNGGGELYVSRVLGSGASAATIALAAAVGSTPSATVTAKNKGADGNNLRIQCTAAGQSNYYNLTVYKETVAGTSSDVTNDTVLEIYNNVRFDDATSPDYIGTVVNGSSANIVLSAITNNAPSLAVIPLATGSDGTAPVASDYSAKVATDGTSIFDQVDRPLVIFAPEIMSVLGATNGAAVQDSLIAWAQNNTGFAVLDTASGLTVSGAGTYATSRAAASQAAIYFPNIYIQDPLGRSPQSLRLIGPAGSVVGTYLQTDKQSGPFKAPAGIQANLSGVIATERTFTTAELDTMNTAVKPLNAIRNIPGAGFVVMGARTLKQDGSANRYVNMRRSLIYIKKSLKDLTQFALFANNDEVLWSQIRGAIDVFLNQYRNQGGLRGATAADAYYIKCDAENNTADSIANGEVHIEIGVALQYPAEFVVINLSQQTAA